MRLKGLLVPEHLVRLVETGQWRGWLSAETLARIAPGMDARIELCESFDDMASNSGMPRRLGRDYVELFHVYLGSQTPAKPLPWMDEEQSLFIAVGDYGDDTGFALDYRANAECPRVVGGFWERLPHLACQWKVVANSFDAFAHVLGF